MAINIDKAISWFKSMSGTRYSMNGSRNGSDGTGDCSGMVVTALYKGGASKPAWLYNTDSMHDWLIANGFELIAFNKSWNMQKGDVIILGLKGQSTGAAGHTALAVDGKNIIDCAWYGSSSVNAVRVRNENQLPYSMGFYVYRLKKRTSTVNKPQEKITQGRSSATGGLWYRSHLSNVGWLGFVGTEETSGTTGKAISVEAIDVRWDNQTDKISASFQDIKGKWHEWNYGVTGTTGKGLPFVKVRFDTGVDIRKTGRTLQYRVHSADVGWSEWTNQGETVGTSGKQIEAIQMRMLKDGKVEKG